MRRPVRNFEPLKGDSFTFRVRLKTRAADGTTAIQDLTGQTVIFTAAWDGGELVLSSADGDIAVDLDTAEITWTLTDEQIEPMPIGTSTQYKVQTAGEGGTQTRLLGNLHVGKWADNA